MGLLKSRSLKRKSETFSNSLRKSPNKTSLIHHYADISQSEASGPIIGTTLMDDLYLYARHVHIPQLFLCCFHSCFDCSDLDIIHSCISLGLIRFAFQYYFKDRAREASKLEYMIWQGNEEYSTLDI